MDKKRSKGVTFWGWLFIVSSIMSLIQQISPRQQIQFFGIAVFVFTVVISVAFLVCGIFILKLSEAARKAAIWLCIISVLVIPVYIKQIIKVAKSDDYYAMAKQRIVQEIKPEYQQQALENLEKSKETGRKALSSVITAIVLLWLIFELAPVYFFTRAPVKEQFKQTEVS